MMFKYLGIFEFSDHDSDLTFVGFYLTFLKGVQLNHFKFAFSLHDLKFLRLGLRFNSLTN